MESDRKVDEDAEEAEKLVLNLLQSEEKEKEENIAGFLDGDKAFLKKLIIQILRNKDICQGWTYRGQPTYND